MTMGFKETLKTIVEAIEDYEQFRFAPTGNMNCGELADWHSECATLANRVRRAVDALRIVGGYEEMMRVFSMEVRHHEESAEAMATAQRVYDEVLNEE